MQIRKPIAIIRVPLKLREKEFVEYIQNLSLNEDYHVLLLFEDLERVTIQILCK